MKSRSIIPLFAVLAIAVLWLCIGYGNALLHPNDQILHTSIDGYKNYYTPLYHIYHDTSYTWFGGMNYPDGEHIVYTDAQPLISNALRWIHLNVVDLGNAAPGILVLILLLGILPAVACMYGIHRELGLPTWWAAGAALLIVLLSPQWARLSGHYALAHIWAIPLVLWLTLRWLRVPNWPRAGLIAIAIFLEAWIHPYLLMASFILVGGLCLGRITLYFHRANPAFLMQAALALVLPILVFMLIMRVTDPVAHRPQHPNGMAANRAHIGQLIAPHSIPALKSVANIIPVPKELTNEGNAYLGLVSVIGLGAIAMGWGRRSLRQWRSARKKAWLGYARPFANPLANAMAWASGIALVIATGFPAGKHLEQWAEWLPFLTQFRSSGRFAWICYYILTVLVAHSLWRWVSLLQRRGRKLLPKVVVAAACAITLAECILLQAPVSNGIVTIAQNPSNAQLRWAGTPSGWQAAIDPKDYSALLVLPYFHIGSENFDILSDISPLPAMSASLHTGLPLLNVNLSRTSLYQTWDRLALLSPPDPESSLAKRLSTTCKPILIALLAPSDRMNGQALLDQADSLGIFQGVTLLSLPPSNLLKIKAPMQFPKANSILPDSHQTQAMEWHFEDEPTEISHGGRGALKIDPRKQHILYEGKLPGPPDASFQITMWVRLKQDGAAITGWGRFENTPQGNPITYLISGMKDHIVRVDGEWALLESIFIRQSPSNIFKMVVRDAKPSCKQMWIDDLIIKPL